MSLSEKLTIVDLVFSFLGVVATATGFYLVVRQINLSRAVTKADFIIRLEQKFADFAPTYSKFQPDREWSPSKPGPAKEDYTEVVTYLDFIATFPLLMKEGVIDFQTVNRMFAYRFFMTMNNPHIKSLLLYHKNYWGNLHGLYKDWKQFRVVHNNEIPQSDYMWNADESCDVGKDAPHWFPL